MATLSVPPLPPSMAGTAAPQQGQMPSMMQLSGMGGPDPSQMGGGQTPTAGMSQISESVVRMSAEIDQSLKLLAQAVPQIAPWVEKTILELRFQIGTALQQGLPTNPTPQDNPAFPDGGARL